VEELVSESTFVAFLALDSLLEAQGFDASHLVAETLEKTADDQPRMRSAEAKVGSEAKSHMRVWLPVETHLGGAFEDCFVIVLR